MSVNYDTLASDYVNYRIPDPHSKEAIKSHIAPGSRVLNVGAGQGSYEPEECAVTAIEPSLEMIARRASSTALVIQGFAESLPFEDDSFDVSLAILTIHHWKNTKKGLLEMQRVTRDKVIILTWNGEYDLCEGLSRLRNDIDSGQWHEKYENLLAKAKLDCGYRLLVHDKNVA